VALHRATQAHAWLDGRRFALPDDVRAMAIPVLAHRLVLDVDRMLRGDAVEGVVEELLATLPVPPVLD
jgi:MoxR-like ATPase